MLIKIIAEVSALENGLDEIPLQGRIFEAIHSPDKTHFWVFLGTGVFQLRGSQVEEVSHNGSEVNLKEIVTAGGKSLSSVELKFR